MSSSILDEPVKKFIHKKVVALDSGETVERAAKTMRDEQVGSILVSERGETVGIVTERDILYKVVAGGKDSSKLKLKDIMSSPLLTIGADSSVKEAIALMSKNQIRRLAVKEGGNIVGVISQRAVVGDIHRSDISIAEVDIPVGVLCPYCGSRFDNKDDLSKHIDRIHLGAGLLEGDVRRY